MRTKGLIACTGTSVARYKSLKRRSQLPFVVEPGYLEDPNSFGSTAWSEYSILNAISLRVMLDLMDHKSPFNSKGVREESDFHGLRVETALKVASNGMMWVHNEGYSVKRLLQLGEQDCWIAWFAYREIDDQVEDFTDDSREYHGGDFHAGELEKIVTKLAQRGENMSRVVLVNVSRAARQVRAAGIELGIRDFEDLDGEV